ncbi:MAG: ABC transporter permease [Alkalispirochaetaceae bacterium]
MSSLDLAFLLGTTVMYATPLIFAALGGTITENAGVINIGLEGMMVIGAFMGATAGFYFQSAWVGFLAAGLAGGLLALLHGIATVTFQANQIVSGIAMNFLGGGLALFLSRLFFDGATQTIPLSLDDKMPRPLNGLFPRNSFSDLIFNQYATVFIAFAMVGVVWFFLYKTRLGLRIRSVGEHPEAADSLGINVYRVRYFAVISSGVLAGFGGASLSIAVVSRFMPTLISGQGYIALAAMIFGKWRPQGALVACLLFGAAQAFVVLLGGTDFVLPSELLATLPYVVTLIALVAFVGRQNAPAADGQPFESGQG